MDHAQHIDSRRLEANTKLDPINKAVLGQFMTPSTIADFMASLFSIPRSPAKLLDCGAGIGSLTLSAVKRLRKVEAIEAWEIDPVMRGYLDDSLRQLKTPYVIHASDFIDDGVINVATERGTRFTHAILNPPYKKIGSGSTHRLLLRKIGIETVNLYTAFLALTIRLMEPGGEIVAIVPRSFCNGPYYRPFRVHLLRHCSIAHIHVFESRNNAFKDDDVLQENIIIKLIRGKPQQSVCISISHDQALSDYEEKIVPFSEVVMPNDAEQFFHIPTSETPVDKHPLFAHPMADLGLEVCTGPVVDFRLKDYWLQSPTADSIPLIYPHHFENRRLVYPRDHKKPNALKRHPDVAKWLMPRGCYVIVKRFSAKEEKRRVVAYVVKSGDIKTDHIGFENHWNVFHTGKKGIPATLANGLACFLNSTALDEYFRKFSGHTQVNATDLRNLKYPSLQQLKALGKKYRDSMTQEQIDELADSIE